MGTFFPATSIDGLSDHEKSSILELVDIFQLDNFTSLIIVIVPFRLISLVSFNDIKSVPYLNLAQIFKGRMV